MGFLQKLKVWFQRLFKRDVQETRFEPVEDSSVKVAVPPSEAQVLIEEHQQLAAERTRLKKEIKLVDTQYDGGEIEAAERDRAYRTRLARAGSISIRQKIIRSRLNELGHPLSQEQQSSQVA